MLYLKKLRFLFAWWLLCGVAGGRLVRTWAKTQTAILPYPQLAAALLLLAVIVAGLALQLRWRLRQVKRLQSALIGVRILAAARASQLLAGLCLGAVAGSAVWMLPLLAQLAPGIWLPAVAAFAAAALLLNAGLVAEACCKLPPGSDEPREVAESAAPGLELGEA